MTDDKKLHEEKLLLGLNNQIKLHIVLKDGVWKNGFVKKIGSDFFMFEDAVHGIEPIFFLEVKKIEPYVKGGKKESENGRTD